MIKADYLIVGQGVAGSVLAWTLDQLGCRVYVCHNPTLPSASRVAAGIVNPLTGRKLVRTWRVDDLFPFLHQFYREIEARLSGSFFHSLPVYRPYRSLDEKTAYEAFTSTPEVIKYVDQFPDSQTYSPWIENPYGGLEVKHGGWLDLPRFLNLIAEYFRRKSQLFSGNVTTSELKVSDLQVQYAGIQFRKVLFCDGVQGIQNGLFDWLPYNIVKGQLLTARVSSYPIKAIVNQGVFILPIDETTVKIGATYSWHDLDWQTTTEGRSFLESKVQAILKIPYEVIGQVAGIRPATKDRRPFIGLHPAYPAVGIFGGFGSKGVSLTPYLAQQFARFLLLNEELDSEVNIQRCHSLYYRS